VGRRWNRTREKLKKTLRGMQRKEVSLIEIAWLFHENYDFQMRRGDEKFGQNEGEPCGRDA
jgi:hypothetical protein